RQVGDVEGLFRGGADEVARCADLVDLVVERAEPVLPRAGHGQSHPGQHGDVVQGDLGALARRVGPDVLAHIHLTAAVGDQGHPKHQVVVDGPAAVADVAGDVAGYHRALRETEKDITG